MAPPNRPVDLPKSTNDTACFFFWLQNLRDCILLLVDISWWKIPLIFVPSQRIGNRWTSDGKREFSRWFWFKWKVRQSGRFLAWKTSEKRLFYRLKRNYFTFRLFGMLYWEINNNHNWLLFNIRLSHIISNWEILFSRFQSIKSLINSSNKNYLSGDTKKSQ